MYRCSGLRTLLPPLTAALLVSSSVAAGQLHVRRFGLGDVARQGGHVMEVEILSRPTPVPDSKDLATKVRVTRVWSSKTAQLRDIRMPMDVRPEVGTETAVTLYGGVIWDNPRKSPIDTRLAGAMPIGNVRRGGTVILVPSRGRFEALESDAKNRRKLDLLFDAARLQQYESQAASEELLGDLADRDLGPIALAALQARGEVDPGTLIASPISPTLLRQHYAELAPTEQASFLRGALGPLRKSPERIEMLIEIGLEQLDADTAAPLAEIYGLLRLDSPQELTMIRDLRATLDDALQHSSLEQRPKIANPFVEPVISYFARRESRSASEPELAPYLAALDADARARCVAGLAELVHGSRLAGDSFDLDALNGIEAAVVADPSPRHLDALAAINPMTPKDRLERESLLDSLLSMGVAIAEAHPPSAARVVTQIEPHLLQDLRINDRTLLARYHALVSRVVESGELGGEVMKDRAVFELRLGDVRVAPGGFRLSFEKDEDGPTVTVHWGKHSSQGFGVGRKDHAYVERVSETRITVVERLSVRPPRARVTLFAPAAERPNQIGQPAALKLGRKVAEENGCPDYGDWNNELWNGLFWYDGKGPRGRRCKVTIGTWTGTVISVEVDGKRLR